MISQDFPSPTPLFLCLDPRLHCNHIQTHYIFSHQYGFRMGAQMARTNICQSRNHMIFMPGLLNTAKVWIISIWKKCTSHEPGISANSGQDTDEQLFICHACASHGTDVRGETCSFCGGSRYVTEEMNNEYDAYSSRDCGTPATAGATK